MMYRSTLLLAIFIFSITASAQNLVVNGSFEELSGKPKEPGQVFLAPPWVAGTKAGPDIYSPKAKDDRIKVPENAYGEQKPKDGQNYAGILIYSNREAEPRSYLTQKLKYPMLAGEYYCVKFHICFADLSKYAANNIGCYISKDSVGSETDLMLSFKPQIINSTNRIFEKQWDWEDICRIYVADGGEQYLTIGNFASQDETQTISVKRPSGFTSTQTRDGYYYIDHITVTPNGTAENCKCEPGDFAFANLNKDEASFETATEDIPDKVIVGTTGSIADAMAKTAPLRDDIDVNFSLGKASLEAKGTAALNLAIEYLKENDKANVTLVGHVDDSESVKENLSKDRLAQVEKYLVSKGIDESRIESQDVFNKEPIDNSGNKDKRYLNMVVQVKFSE